MAAVSLPAGLAGRVVLVGVSDAPIMLFAEFVLRRIRIGIAPQPEVFDKGVALLVVRESLEGLALFVGDDVGHILIQPGFVCALQLLPDGLLSRELLLVGALALERVNFLILAIGGLCLCRWVVRLLG